MGRRFGFIRLCSFFQMFRYKEYLRSVFLGVIFHSFNSLYIFPIMQFWFNQNRVLTFRLRCKLLSNHISHIIVNLQISSKFFFLELLDHYLSLNYFSQMFFICRFYEVFPFRKSEDRKPRSITIKKKSGQYKWYHHFQDRSCQSVFIYLFYVYIALLSLI